MNKSELIDKWQKEYQYHIKLANDVGLKKYTRVQSNNYASGIRDVLNDLKNLSGETVKFCEGCETPYCTYPAYKDGLCTTCYSMLKKHPE